MVCETRGVVAAEFVALAVTEPPFPTAADAVLFVTVPAFDAPGEALYITGSIRTLKPAQHNTTVQYKQSVSGGCDDVMMG